MSETDALQNDLKEWRNCCFRAEEITLTDAATALSIKKKQLVEAKPGHNAGKWTLYNTETDKVAILTHAGLLLWVSDLETGNYVPPGQKAPPGIAASKLQNEISYKCEFSYSFDTSADDSLYTHIQTLENQVISNPNFNRGGRNRNRWQDGTARKQYTAVSKMFAKKSPFNTTDGKPMSLPFNVHEWLTKGLQEQGDADGYVVNPERPKYYDRVNGNTVKLCNADPPYFRRGDILWFSFRLCFIAATNNWTSEIVPLEFVRVAVSPENRGNSGELSFGRIDINRQEFEEGAAMIPIKRGDSEEKKRKSSEQSDTETLGSEDEVRTAGGNPTEDETEVTGTPEDSKAGQSGGHNQKRKAKQRKT